MNLPPLGLQYGPADSPLNALIPCSRTVKHKLPLMGRLSIILMVSRASKPVRMMQDGRTLGSPRFHFHLLVLRIVCTVR